MNPQAHSLAVWSHSSFVYMLYSCHWFGIFLFSAAATRPQIRTRRPELCPKVIVQVFSSTFAACRNYKYSLILICLEKRRGLYSMIFEQKNYIRFSSSSPSSSSHSSLFDMPTIKYLYHLLPSSSNFKFVYKNWIIFCKSHTNDKPYKFENFFWIT